MASAALVGICCFTPPTDKWSNICRLKHSMEAKATQNSSVVSSATTSFRSSKKTVWVWTESKQVMTAAVQRGWNTFVFQSQKLADDWSSIALIDPLLMKEGGDNIVAAFQRSQKTVFAVSKTPVEAQLFFEALEHGLGGVVLKFEDVQAVLDLKDY
ncbi:hypothetical protein ACLB2K_054130 [Fragaria x ananassa]